MQKKEKVCQSRETGRKFVKGQSGTVYETIVVQDGHLGTCDQLIAPKQDGSERIFSQGE